MATEHITEAQKTIHSMEREAWTESNYAGL